ncbi:YwiC-like family protein [Tessaracoccus palaemonis]|uniref:YwiC-like family protein n=1 Tax=Tessaracoccus palaemonis TaxID=2829499 RepID=A0ABX8SIG9_9ACTN|nr:YwiC-like family protein [Tessaracoccus palaemonis]QXT63181.1 YwiC-like family protein [Tessaracoccus palaemonis]
MAKSSSWVPRQHGAWAMLLVPSIVGVALASRVRPLGWADLTLCLTWLVGYFAFSAAVLVLKSTPKRRGRHYSALATYGVAAAALGVATLILRGPTLLWWVPVYALLLGPALWWAATRRERSLASGVTTVLASCGLMAVLRLVPGAPQPTASEWALMAIVTLYFVGTVLHVKALIRERNDPTSARRSVAYHATVAALIVAAIAVGWLGWPWILFAVALPARAWWMPRAPRRPMQIGLLEVALSVALLALAVWA